MPSTMLLIMDGFGLGKPGAGNAICAAKTPNIDRFFSEYPSCSLQASGRFVGLPDGQMGNSEVGHTNMGAGRIVWQELSNISNQIENGRFFENENLLFAVERAKKNGKALHLMGLLSDGGVHSHIKHLFALLDMAKANGLSEVYVHAITDGRDTPPRSAEKYIAELLEYTKKIGCGKLASISGRYYAMDRDKRWERIEKAYDLYTLGLGADAPGEESDEFIVPYKTSDFKPVSDGDSVIFYNFRPDRARQITRCFADPAFAGFERKKILKDLCYVCFTQYDATIPNVRIAFPPQSLKNTLGEYISALEKKQLRIAETEKYAHVTFFFNGGVEEPYAGEDRILVNSPKVATYDLQPEMSAFEVTEKVVSAIESEKYDLIIMNLANCDMVGHTGVFSAAVKAVETVDECVGKIEKALLKTGGQMLLTADHGNCDEMVAEDGTPMTAHTTNPVPLFYIGPKEVKFTNKKDAALCDLAPTLLTLMNLSIPAEMEGSSLV